jgi:hypothetical protein
MAYRFMKENRYAIEKMAVLFGVGCSACYRWARYGVSERRRTADTELVYLIRELPSTHHRRYGSPRVRKELRRVYGKGVSRKKAATIDAGTYAECPSEREVYPQDHLEPRA